MKRSSFWGVVTIICVLLMGCSVEQKSKQTDIVETSTDVRYSAGAGSVLDAALHE